MQRSIRVANFSAAWRDDKAGLHDVVHGDPADVLIGDYLAELTIGVVTQAFVQTPDPSAEKDFYIDLFLKQLTPELPEIAARKLKIITNAGALNPEGLAQRIREEIASAGLDLKVASVAGDNLLPRVQELANQGQLDNLDTGQPMGNLSGRMLAANAYLGAWGIVEALKAGADIVIAGRVTDASLTLGPAAWWHGWSADDWDAIAGGIAAGHIIECGAHAVGGNFSGFRDLARVMRFGFPLAEIAADGSCVITKQSRGQGTVNADTVTAQLLYEIQGPRYLNPDAVLHMDSIQVADAGKDRVAISGVRGSPPPPTTKAACYYHDGWSMVMFTYLTGIDWREKVEWTRDQMQSVVDRLSLDDYVFEPLGQPVPSPRSREEATMVIRIAAAAQGKDQLEKLGAEFGTLMMHGFPGFAAELGWSVKPRIEFWPGIVGQRECEHYAVLDDGRRIEAGFPEMAAETMTSGEPFLAEAGDPGRFGPTRRAALGELFHARSGDKGGNASLGVWCKNREAFEWLVSCLSAERVHALMGLRDNVAVDAFPLENVHGQLYVLRGLLGSSGTGNIAVDQMGKGVGEHFRSCVTDIPVRFLDRSPARGATLQAAD